MGNILDGKTPKELAKLKISTAKSQAMSNTPFFGYLMMSAEYIASETMQTLATDGDKVYYNVDFVNKLSLGELTGVITHEILHIAFLHMFRRGVRDPAKWNLACDYVVNYVIKNNEHMDLPENIVYSEKYSNDWSAEEIYADISKNPPKVLKYYQMALDGDDGNSKGKSKGKGNGKDAPIMDGHIYDANKKNDPSHAKIKEQEWKGKLTQAAQVARQQGHLPAGMERLIDEALQETVPWQQLLRRYLSPYALKTDFTWSKPNKKFLQYDMIMPGYTSESLEIGCVLDTSGSISPKELSAFVSEVRGIMSVAKSYTIHLIACDAKVDEENGYWKITEFSGPLPKSFGGGGGTDFRPPFKEIAKRNLKPSVLIYFTDGYGAFPEKPPSFETIWAVVPGGIKKENIPWGTFIPIKLQS